MFAINIIPFQVKILIYFYLSTINPINLRAFHYNVIINIRQYHSNSNVFKVCTAFFFFTRKFHLLIFQSPLSNFPVILGHRHTKRYTNLNPFSCSQWSNSVWKRILVFVIVRVSLLIPHSLIYAWSPQGHQHSRSPLHTAEPYAKVKAVCLQGHCRLYNLMLLKGTISVKCHLANDHWSPCVLCCILHE